MMLVIHGNGLDMGWKRSAYQWSINGPIGRSTISRTSAILELVFDTRRVGVDVVKSRHIRVEGVCVVDLDKVELAR